AARRADADAAAPGGRDPGAAAQADRRVPRLESLGARARQRGSRLQPLAGCAHPRAGGPALDLAGHRAGQRAHPCGGHAGEADCRSRLSGDRHLRRLALSGRGPAGESARDVLVRLSSRRAPGAALATELVYGTLRWQRYLDWILAPHSRRRLESLDPRVRVLLRMTAYQIAFLERVPAFAAVNDAVTLAPRTPGVGAFVNAVLR